MANFEEFADSSLALTLRAYLPDLDHRLKTITELHADIDKQFAAADIEIAFPQRDLHLRTGWEATREGNSSDGAMMGRERAHSSSDSALQPASLEQNR